MSIETIGKVINNLRKEKKITQEELANSVGVSTQAVSKWECGGAPDIELLLAIADFFNVTLDKLFGREENNYDGVEMKVAGYIASLDREKQYAAWYNLCWDIQRAMFGSKSLDDEIKSIYSFHGNSDKNASLVPFLILAKDIITSPQGFRCSSDGNNKFIK